jgi:hypothetical protein
MGIHVPMPDGGNWRSHRVWTERVLNQPERNVGTVTAPLERGTDNHTAAFPSVGPPTRQPHQPIKKP